MKSGSALWRGLGLLAASLALSACRSAEFLLANAPTLLDRVERTRDLPYGADARQRLDVYAPPGAHNLPVVIFWYGGSWTAGAKAEYRFVGATLAQRGLVAVLPDYRLYPQVTFPHFDADAARAVAWVEQHIKDFGGDPRRIVLMGHSAGAHTAAFLAFNPAFLAQSGADPKPIRGLVALSGPYVLAPDTEVLRATFPAPFTAKDWQPIAFVTTGAPPTLLLHGQDDTQVSPRQAIELRDALEQHQVRVELKLYPRRGHGSPLASFAPIARWSTSAVHDTVAFIASVTGDP